MSEKVISRRKFLVTSISAGVLGIVIGAAGAWLAKPEVVAEKTVTETVTREVTRTVTVTTTPLPTVTPTVGFDPVTQRAIDGVTALLASGKARPGDTIRILHVAGSRANLEKAIELW
ncbi:MAG: hypothetical protein QXT84_07305, partial [Candidatus Bathyarchaeia archaeon]